MKITHINSPNLKTYLILNDDINKCKVGHMEKVKYLLTSKDLERNVYKYK